MTNRYEGRQLNERILPEPVGSGADDAGLPPSAPDFSPLHHDLVRRVLTDGGCDAQAAADTAAAALGALFADLEPLLGSRAMRALYGRSIYLARSSFAQPVGMPEGAQHFLDPLRANLASRTAEDASLASKTLLVTFSDLLITILGEPIAMKALRSAWGNVATTLATRDKSE